MSKRYREEIKIGTKINRFTILKKVAPENKRGVFYLCQCDCGKLKTVYCSLLLDNQTKSCGCLKRDKLNAFNKSHGMSNTRIYNIWAGIRNRCTNKNVTMYRYYGGRGIKLHESWRSFENFYRDMSPSYQGHLTIDRIDNNGNYCKENCRWATTQEQMNNHGHCHYVLIGNESKSIADWCRQIGISYNTVLSRMYKKKMSAKEALLTPVGGV